MTPTGEARFYWCSFYADNAPMSAFEYHGPWWRSGYGPNDEEIICAAVMAESGTDAMEVLRQAFDEAERPEKLTERFAEPKGWSSPYTDRFPKADWMQWPWPKAEASDGSKQTER